MNQTDPNNKIVAPVVSKSLVEDLRQIIRELWTIEINETSIADMVEKANIIRG